MALIAHQLSKLDITSSVTPDFSDQLQPNTASVCDFNFFSSKNTFNRFKWLLLCTFLDLIIKKRKV